MPSYEHVVAEITARPWAIEKTHGERLAQILSRRLAGGTATGADLAAVENIRAERDRKKARRTPRNVAVIPIYGTMVPRADIFTETSGLLSCEQIGQLIDAAVADPAVDVIVLDIDSPGGSVFGTAELAAKVAAARRVKRVVAVANHLACSAAFWVATQASEFVVSPSSMVGSVGVFLMHVDESEAIRTSGRAVTFISSTPEKVAGASEKPLDATGHAEMERTVNGYYAEFVRGVAAGRGVSQGKVREDYGRGGTVLAKDAVSRGMADRVATMDDTIGRLIDGGGAKASTSRLTPTAEGTHPEVAKRRAKLADAAEIDRRRASLDADRRALALSASPRTPALTLPTHLRRRVAVHEAGHAVVAHVLGDRSAEASIEPDSTTFGRCTHAGSIGGTGHGVFCLAGLEAESLYATAEPSAGYTGAGDDELFSKGLPAGVREDCRRRARRILGGCALSVPAVAAILHDRGKVTAAEVAAVLNKYPPQCGY